MAKSGSEVGKQSVAIHIFSHARSVFTCSVLHCEITQYRTYMHTHVGLLFIDTLLELDIVTAA